MRRVISACVGSLECGRSKPRPYEERPVGAMRDAVVDPENGFEFCSL